MGQDLGQSVALCDALGDIFCLTFVRGVGASEALRRFGAYPDTFADLSREQMYERQTSFDLGYPRMAGAVVFGDWTVVLEPNGFQGVGPVLAEVSRGAAAVGVLRHEHAESQFVYAVDGTEMTAFLPGWMDRVWGAEALADADAARFPGVPVTAPLGRAVRGWLQAAVTAGESLNGPARHRMSYAERRHGYRLGWFAFALRATLYPDEDLAVRAALHPLGNGSAPLADPAAHAAAIDRLTAGSA